MLVNANLKNWGRWGQDDQQGTLNLITPEEIKVAAQLVRTGKVYSLSMPLDAEGPQFPMRHKTWKTTSLLNVEEGSGFSDDVVIMHSHSGTHMDSLCHVWSDYQLYNGFDAREHVTSFGSTRNSIENVPALVGRGILLDIARWKGVRHLSLGETISASDLDQCAARQNTTIAAGDIVLVNTGWMNIFAQNRAVFDSGEPGLDMSCIEWLHQHAVSAIGADNQGVEVIATMPPSGLPFHFAAIRDLGLYLIENLKLQPLAGDKKYEFLFVAAPLQLTSAVGSPINPLAIV
jgi:kynurenine formamidase